VCGFLDREAGKEPALHNTFEIRRFFGKCGEGVIYVQNLGFGRFRRYLVIVYIDVLSARATLLSEFAPGMIDEHLTHGA